MPRRSFSVASAKTEQGRAILIEQYRTLGQQIPLMYALMFIDAAFLSFASYGTVDPVLSIGMPAGLAIVAMARALFWLGRRQAIPDPVSIRRYLIGTIYAAALLSLGFGGWGLILFAEADLARRTCIALYIFIGAISCCYCLQSLPRAGRLVLLCGAMPVTVWLLCSRDWFLMGLGINMVIVSILILRMLDANYSGFIEVLTSRSEMIAEQRRARHAEQCAHELAYHDPLTGLPNRRALAEHLSAMIEQRGDDAGFGLLVLDLDRFKPVNDVYGHPVGDLLLREVSARLIEIVGAEGGTYRLGGDEFAILVHPSDDGRDAARRVAHRIVLETARPFALQERVHHIGASVGIALFPEDGSDRETLMRRADVALYKAKELGGGQHCAFAPRMDAEIRRRSVLESEMHEALAGDAFHPHYQPIVDLATGAAVGFELLARWRRGDDADIGPEQFIPIAEECGLINDLMLKLLERACAETREWNPALTIAINVSPIQLRDAWLSEKILSVLARMGFPSHRLAVEITENALIVDAENAKNTIQSLKNQGIQLALDDFGTGYSSIQHLRMLPFDKIKIDRSFVQALGDDPEALKIVRAVTSLAATLDLEVVAEGIEHPATAALLLQLGCAQGQGFYFGRPMSKAEAEAWIAAGGPAEGSPTAMRAA
jgi:diguanylate cyclase (GGDEF)-like protein